MKGHIGTNGFVFEASSIKFDNDNNKLIILKQ
jgi:hypothetical protein